MRLCKLLLLLPLSLFGLDRMPWYCNMWEFTFTPTYTYSRFPKVQHGTLEHQKLSHVHLLALNLAVPPTPQLEIDSEVEFADTPHQSMGLRSLAVQG